MPFIGELSALLAAGLWAGTSMIYAAVSEKIGSVQVNINRMLFSLGWFVLAFWLLHTPLAVSRTQLLYLVLSSLVGIIFGDTFLFKAFQEIGARISMLIMSISPAIGAVLAYIFLHEILSWWAIFGMIITMGGIALVVLERTPTVPSAYKLTKPGLLYAFLGALGQGGGIVLSKVAFAEGEIHGLLAAFIRIAVALLVMLPAAQLAGHYVNPWTALRAHRRLLVLLMIGSFLGTFLGITLSLVAVAYTHVGVASTLIAMSPVLMLPMVRMISNERLSWKAIIGAVIAVSGVALLFVA